MSNPYFYIIEHIETEIKYAGIRFKDNCDPSELLTEDGYKTSSKIVKQIIKNEGLESFKILEIKNFDDVKSCRNYETRFLKDHDCRNSDEWFNKKTAREAASIPKLSTKLIHDSYKIKELPSYEYLHECFEYDKDGGILIWKIRPLHHFKNPQSYQAWNTKYSGKNAGTYNKTNYMQIHINSVKYLMHRIIWKMVSGNEPKSLIDHKDGNKLNNNFDNLREASSAENQRNRKISKNNSSGYKCVHFHESKKKFRAETCKNGRRFYLGHYDTAEEAYGAYLKFIKENNGEFANDGHNALSA